MRPESDGLQAIVGITPGSSPPGKIVDLSKEPVSHQFGSTGLYQVFLGNEFDLSVRKLLFITPLKNLLFPFYRGDSHDFTGFAFTNDSESDGVFSFQALSTDEIPLFSLGPSIFEIGLSQQVAQLGREFLGVGLQARRDGWVRVESSSRVLPIWYRPLSCIHKEGWIKRLLQGIEPSLFLPCLRRP